MTVRHIPADSADADVGTVVPLPVVAPGGPSGAHAATHMPFSGTDAWRQVRVMTADQQIQNQSTPLINATDLSNFIVVASAQYTFDFVIFYTGPQGGDLKIGIKAPSGAGRWGINPAPDAASTAAVTAQSGVTYVMKNATVSDLTTPGTMNVGTQDEATVMMVNIRGYLVVGVTGGSLAFQFAQRIAQPAPALTKILWYSHGSLERVV